MNNPLFYILAPFGLAFALFAVYLVVSLLIRDPARPFRMFAAGPILDSATQAERLCEELERLGHAPGAEDERVERLKRLLAEGEGERFEELRHRAEPLLESAVPRRRGPFEDQGTAK